MSTYVDWEDAPAKSIPSLKGIGWALTHTRTSDASAYYQGTDPEGRAVEVADRFDPPNPLHAGCYYRYLPLPAGTEVVA